jgi:hypothetical protein
MVLRGSALDSDNPFLAQSPPSAHNRSTGAFHSHRKNPRRIPIPLPVVLSLNCFQGFLFALTAASGKSIKMMTSWFNPMYAGQKIRKILVIGVCQKRTTLGL